MKAKIIRGPKYEAARCQKFRYHSKIHLSLLAIYYLTLGTAAILWPDIYIMEQQSML